MALTRLPPRQTRTCGITARTVRRDRRPAPLLPLQNIRVECWVSFPLPIYGLLRFANNLLGWLAGTVVHLTYTERGEDMQVISLRRAEKHEIRRYIQEISR